MKHSVLYIFIITMLSCFSCVSSKKISQQIKDTTSYCAPTQVFEYQNDAFLTKEFLFNDSVLLKKYSRQDLLLANAAGIYYLLKKMDSLERGNNLSGNEYARIKQDIGLKALLFSSQISSVSAELDCEGERASQMANYVSDIEDKKTKLRTIESVIVGAITGIVTAVTDNNKIDNTVAISGGILTAGLGIMALVVNKKIAFNHSRNLLRDIWFDKNEPTHYPPSIWYVLNEKLFSNTQEHSIRHNIKERWINYSYVKEDSKKDLDLFFGKGGKYTSDQLKTRANMLNQLQSTVREINQNLEILIAKMAINK